MSQHDFNTPIHFKDVYDLKKHLGEGRCIDAPFTVFNGRNVFNTLEEYVAYLNEQYDVDFYNIK